MRTLLALCIALPISGASAQTYITTCKRDGRHLYCVSKPYVKRKVQQPRRHYYPFPAKPKRHR